MNAANVFGILLGFLAALVGILYAGLVWEIRKLRKDVHRHSSWIGALSLMMGIVCKKLGIPWKEPGE